MKTFVLIHGAYRGGWSWRSVRRLLQSAGHEVFAPSLTSAGERRHLLRADLTLQTWIDDVVNLLVAEDLREVILVGHSLGGVVITAASEFAADRIAHLVYLDAPVPQHGQSAIELVPDEIRARFGNAPRTDFNLPMPLRASETFSETQVQWINERLTAMPVHPSLDPMQLTSAAALALPRHYFFCANTPEFFPSTFTRKRFDTESIPYQLLNTGHDVILSHPQLVADLLTEIAAAR